MSKLIMVTGGARSGKSRFAEKLSGQMGSQVVYFATAAIFDEEMQQRVDLHQKQRPSVWQTIEAPQNEVEAMGKALAIGDTVLLDCVTVMVNNMIYYSGVDIASESGEVVQGLEREIIHKVEALLDMVRKADKQLILVTNELGMGIVPEQKLSRVYRDIAGRVNQRVAALCDEVYFVVSGIPIKIKNEEVIK